MKLIVAIIQPAKVDYVTSAIRRAGLPGATVTEAKGFGAENVVSDWDLSGELTDKAKVEIVLSDDRCDEIVSLIEKTVGMSKAGSGFIYVQDVIYNHGYHQPSDAT